MFRKDRKSRGGGVLLYIKENLISVDENCGEGTESIWVKVKLDSKKEICVGVCYRAPATNSEEEKKLIDTIAEIARKPCVIMGDFNFPDINWDLQEAGPRGKDFLEQIQDSFLIQKVSSPTRGAAILDLVLTTEVNLVSDMEIICPIANCDHNVLLWHMDYSNEKGIGQELGQNLFKYDRGNYSSLNGKLLEYEWEGIIEGKNVNEIWNELKLKMINLRDEFVPIRKLNKRKTPQFVDTSILKRIKKRNRMWKKYRENPDVANETNYKKERNEIINEIRRAKKNFESKLANKIKVENKAFYAYVNSKRVCKEKLGPLMDATTGRLICESAEIVNILNDYFASVFTNETEIEKFELGQDVTDEYSNVLNNVEITNENFLKTISKIKRNKTEGIDGLNSTLFIECGMGLVTPLHKIFSMSLDQSVMPLDWKMANVSPIFKKGSKKDRGNYRPVSLTCHACKILERIIKDEIVKFLEDNNKLTSSQHGFRCKRSCLTNLLDFMKRILSFVDEGEPVDLFFFDLQNAFDKVPHKRLLYKIHEMGIQGKVLRWIEEWLIGRKQRVILNGCESGWEDVTSGVPQGSVLGPILFLIYINDMEDKVSSLF